MEEDMYCISNASMREFVYTGGKLLVMNCLQVS